jgi:hypothetical protein
MNPYEALSIPPDASEEEIRRAYRKRAAQFHTDNQSTGDAEKFKEVCDAEQLLMDPQRRQIYDTTGVILGDDPLGDRAIMMVTQIGNEVAAQNPDCNIVEGIREALKTARMNAGHVVWDMKKARENITNRWKRDDILKRVLLQNLSGTIITVQNELAVIDRALEMLAKSEYAMPAFVSVASWDLYQKRKPR